MKLKEDRGQEISTKAREEQFKFQLVIYFLTLFHCAFLHESFKSKQG